ncbi:GAF domain-containing protein [Mycobacterium sp. E2479]|uniref:GAF domain-containing protein n=1 Tax=Mycobacterium sp. E2479 TaxID=1834134 RepID=UPI0009EDEE7E|nr:GAF domain-containing protein [Mycobacterium sp. E2479]
MPAGAPESFLGGLIVWIGPHLERSRWVRTARYLLPVMAAAATGLSGQSHGAASVVWLGVGIALLALAATGEIFRDSYRSRLRQEQEEGAAGQIVALRDALSPIAEAIADMHTLTESARRERVNGIAQRSADALALVMHGIPGFRSVVYRQDDPMNSLEVLARAGRSEREPQRFTRGDERGNAAFATVERREPCFVRDVNNDDEVAGLDGAYSGTRTGYRTFIAAPIADRQRTYGMVTVDAPNPGDLLRSDQHLVMLVADLLAIAFASIHQ